MAGTPIVSAFQIGKNQNPPLSRFWENQYFVSTVVRILPKKKKDDLCSKICTKDQIFQIFLSKSKNIAKIKLTI